MYTKHQHFFALPIALVALLVLTGIDGLLDAQGSRAETLSSLVISTDAHLKDIILPGSVSARLSPHSTVLTSPQRLYPVLVRGSGVFSATGAFAISTKDITIISANGGIFIEVHQDGVTAVALTSSFVLDHQSGSILCPRGSQVFVDAFGHSKLSLVPTSWLKEKISLLPSSPSFTRLDSQEARSMQDEALAQSAIVHPYAPFATAFSFALQSPNLLSSGALVVLTSSPLFTEVVPQFLPSLLRSFPAPLPLEIIDLWHERLLYEVASSASGSLQKLQYALPIPSLLEEAGYPKQAMLWKSRILHVAEVLKPLLSSVDQNILNIALRVAFVQRQSFTQQQPSSQLEISSDSSNQLSAKDLQDRTYQMLLMFDFLLADDTRLAVPIIGDQLVVVEKVFRNEDGADHRYDFEYLPAFRTLRSIMRDGVRLPNSIVPELLPRVVRN